MPRRRFTSGRKFSTTTSAFFTMRLKAATASGAFKLSVMLRLLRCRFWKSDPSRGPPSGSPPQCSGGNSILITLAPQSASWRTQVGPERTRVRSSTAKRERAWAARGKDNSELRRAGQRSLPRTRSEVTPGLFPFELPRFSYIARRGRGGRCSATVRNSFRNNGNERGDRALPADCMSTGSRLVIVGDGEFARIAHEYFTHAGFRRPHLREPHRCE